MFNLIPRKLRIKNSRYKAKKIDFRLIKAVFVALLFTLASIYFLYLLIHLGFGPIYSVTGWYGIGLIICVIILAIIYWIIALETYRDVKIDNLLAITGLANFQYVDFYNEYIVVCANSHRFKINYSDVKSMELYVNVFIAPRGCYLQSLKLKLECCNEELKEIVITQEASFKIVDQVYDVLYFAQRCPNFSLKFSNENEILQTTLGKAISSYLNNNCHHTFRSFAQTTKGVFLLLVIILLLLLVLFWFKFPSLFN